MIKTFRKSNPYLRKKHLLLKSVFTLLILGQTSASFASNNQKVKSCHEIMIEIIQSKENYAGAGFLLEKNRNRHTLPEVSRAEALAKMAGVKKAHTPINKVAAWLAIIEHTHRSDLGENSLNILKQYYFRKYVMTPEDIPDSYFDLQRKIARDQGRGDLILNQETKANLSEIVITDQKESLEEWIDYFLSIYSAQYPMWAKIWVFEEVVKLRSLETGSKSFSKRTKNTVAKFPELDHGALGIVMDGLTKKVNKGPTENLDPELLALLKQNKFSKLYAWAINRKTSLSTNLAITDGLWIRYEKGSDPTELVKSLYCKNTGWCTEGASTAADQLKKGDFYVYYSKDLSGSPTQPRLAIRLEESAIVEVRGIAKGQHMDSYMARTDVLDKKLKEFGAEGEAYRIRTQHRKKLTNIERKTEQGENLSLNELRFLYEVDEKIQGFGNNRDTRIDDIQKTTPLSHSLRRFPENEQKEFILTVFEDPKKTRQIIKDKKSLPYLILFMKDNPSVRKFFLEEYTKREEKLIELILDSQDLSNDLKEKLISKIGSNLSIYEVFQTKNLLLDKSIKDDVLKHLTYHLINVTHNETTLREIAAEGLFSQNVELEGFTKKVLEKLKIYPKTSELSLNKVYQNLLSLQSEHPHPISLREVAEKWIQSNTPSSEDKALFLLSFIGIKQSTFQYFLKKIPSEEIKQISNAIKNQSFFLTFLKNAKNSKLANDLISEGVLESFIFQKKDFPSASVDDAKTFLMKNSGGKVEVTLTHPIEMQATPVTQLQWAFIMERNPSQFIQTRKEIIVNGNKIIVDPNRPVEEVSWNDIQDFIKKLNQTQNEYTYRLPTEAEYEYATRAGTNTKYSFGDDPVGIEKYSWYSENSGSQTQPVAKLRPNQYGLFDTHGNVMEWTQDWYGPRTAGGIDPTGPETGSYRVRRGGSWFHDSQFVGADFRDLGEPSSKSNEVGFRLVRIKK